MAKDEIQGASIEAKTKKEKEVPKRLVKYMGDSDVRRLEKGETFDGQLPAGLDADLEWNWDNGHTLDLSDLPSEVADLIMEAIGPDGDNDFKDVTELKRVPHNKVFERRVGVPRRALGAVRPNAVGGVASSGPGAGGAANTGEGSTPW